MILPSLLNRPVQLNAIALWIMAVIVLVPSLLWSQSQNLPLDHWAYTFLDRLETKGLYISEDFDTRPYSREAIAEIILQINKNVQKNPSLLSSVEWGLFEQLKGEFYEELNSSHNSIDIRKKEYEPHLLTWRNEEIIVRGDGLLGHQNKFESRKEVDSSIPKSMSFLGFALRVDLKKSLAIFAEERTFFSGDTDSLSGNVFNPSLSLPITLEGGDVAITDKAIGYAVARLPWLDIEGGRDLVEWGPGIRGNFSLSRNSDVYDLFKFDFRYKKFKFESFHAFLNSDSTKYLAGRRIEVRPFRNFQFAISETVVYGNRSIEFLYVNPFIPINVAERHLGDKDNNTISFDFTIFMKKRIKFYSEIFLDDFSFHKNLFNNYGNKWAVLVGGYWIDPFGVKNTDLRFELLRIQPFVYTHRISINTYTNYNNIIGHWLGPNADDWYFEISHQPHRNLRFGIFWEQRRRGDNDINRGTPPADGKIHFLDGVVERNRFYGILVQWQIRRDIFLSAIYNFIQSKNLRHQESLNQNNHRLLLQFSLNY
ncbi:MAG: capsule assembly Wzi family protein [bacterium]